MTETGTDNEEAILLRDAEISKLQAALAVAEQAVTTMNLRSAGTSPATGNTTGESNTTVIASTAPAPQTTTAKDDSNDLDAIYENGKLKYTTSIFENLSKEYHPDLINLFNLMPSSKSKGIACL